MKYYKLVRDKIPAIIQDKGQTCTFHVAEEEEYEVKLKEKLREEIEEFLAKLHEEELADVMEVIEALMKFKGIDRDRLERIKQQKRDERGGFDARCILDEA
ncbi:MAG: hypothetical protein COV34_01245 [Candidatus Zambryskibacteria bacterium CG10_big_fil_rev_8_21_14_0_10_42_12]|uniref:Phosphoribosyl-ATP pyrophosphohydrolase n=1 Tax=Candidatus Zambryskibacteria bacterium CG10_big_fil_rev_8_21_14_0_10_42_12 TaxID=1975115 RepID=A0A2H0QVC8_9BACT|nr:MAG: hypothetical protein COV34_01245 [Candidatus Zambryskibacteria bacterium CG10_big_fil_rev_8_21_14_0_10_42_12]